MAEFLLPDLRINLDFYQEDIHRLLAIIKPTWQIQSIKIEPLSGGFSGKMFRCHNHSHNQSVDNSDAVTIRVRQLISNKNATELKIIQYLSKCGHFPKIYAIFGNGYCYHYIQGKPMINARLRKEHITEEMLSCIAKELAFIHSVKLEDIDYSQSQNYNFWKICFEEMDFVRINNSSPSKEILMSEIEFLIEYFKQKNDKIVLCHGDPHPGNFVWDQEKKKVTFVDWENVYIGYQMQDIAHCFMTMNTIETFCSSRTVEEVLPNDYRKKFFKSYVETWHKLNNNENEEIEEEIEIWNTNCEVFELVPLLFFMTLCLTFPAVVEEFSGDCEKFFELMLNKYKNIKEKYMGKGCFELMPRDS